MKTINAALLLVLGASIQDVEALTLGHKHRMRIHHKLDENQKEVSKMWSAAVDAQKEPPKPENQPFHFNLVGLTQDF